MKRLLLLIFVSAICAMASLKKSLEIKVLFVKSLQKNTNVEL